MEDAGSDRCGVKDTHEEKSSSSHRLGAETIPSDRPIASKTYQRRAESFKPLENKKEQRAASMLAQMAKAGSDAVDSDHNLTEELQLKTGILFDMDTMKLKMVEPLAVWAIDNGLAVLASRLSGGPMLKRLCRGIHRYAVLEEFNKAETAILARGQELLGQSFLASQLKLNKRH